MNKNYRNNITSFVLGLFIVITVVYAVKFLTSSTESLSTNAESLSIESDAGVRECVYNSTDADASVCE